jgi:hypothetical protein
MLDVASDRVVERAQSRFDEMVEATRAGFIFAHDNRAAQRWRSRRQRERHPDRPVGLTGASLEQAVFALAASHPDLVAVKV